MQPTFISTSDAPLIWWWGVPYDPYGAAPYRHEFALPFFDFSNEVKMGREFWDFVGGEGTYEELLELYTETGAEFAVEIEALRRA